MFTQRRNTTNKYLMYLYEFVCLIFSFFKFKYMHIKHILNKRSRFLKRWHQYWFVIRVKESNWWTKSLCVGCKILQKIEISELHLQMIQYKRQEKCGKNFREKRMECKHEVKESNDSRRRKEWIKHIVEGNKQLQYKSAKWLDKQLKPTLRWARVSEAKKIISKKHKIKRL